MIIDLRNIPEKYLDNGRLNTELLFKSLNIENLNDLADWLIRLYFSDVQFQQAAAVRLIFTSIMTDLKKQPPSYDDVVSIDIDAAENLCAGCIGMELINVGGEPTRRCQLNGMQKIEWCEAYRLTVIGKRLSESDNFILKQLSVEAQESNLSVTMGGYVEDDPMHDQKIEKALRLLSIVGRVGRRVEDFYDLAKSNGLDEGLSLREFTKIWDPERTTFKYLIPNGLVRLGVNEYVLIDMIQPEVSGGVAERPKAAVLKTADGLSSGGSNPSPSATAVVENIMIEIKLEG